MSYPQWIRASDPLHEFPAEHPTMSLTPAGDVVIEHMGQAVVTFHAATFGAETWTIAERIAPALVQPKGSC